MVENKKQHDRYSELRQNFISGEWVIVSTGRSRRPDEFAVEENFDSVPENDIFADPEASGQEPDVLIYKDKDGEWTTRVFPNKYPLLSEENELALLEEGPYVGLGGVGAHEIVVTRDADKHLARLDVAAVAEVIDAYQDRYLTHMTDRAIRYISIFHNHKQRAGASIAHPHSQILALPIVPLQIRSELDNVNRFYRQNKVGAFDVMMDHELSVRTRLVAENDDFVALCPFAPKMAFEIWVLPKDPQPYFERITDAKKVAAAEVLREALRALDKGLNDPAYNFFIHTAPCDGWDHAHYRWYMEIIPRTAKIAGFELATGMEVSLVSPEEAAEFLRSQLR